MDAFFASLKSPGVQVAAIVVAVVGFAITLLAYRAFQALKLQPGQPTPNAILAGFFGGSFVGGMGLVVLLLSRQ